MTQTAPGATRGTGLLARAASWYVTLPPRHRDVAQDTVLALTLAVLNLLSLLPYQSQLHPSWLALLLVTDSHGRYVVMIQAPNEHQPGLEVEVAGLPVSLAQ